MRVDKAFCLYNFVRDFLYHFFLPVISSSLPFFVLPSNFLSTSTSLLSVLPSFSFFFFPCSTSFYNLESIQETKHGAFWICHIVLNVFLPAM